MKKKTAKKATTKSTRKPKALQPTPLTFRKLIYFFWNKKTYSYPFVALATGAALHYWLGFDFWQVTIFSLMQMYTLRFIDNHFDQDYDIVHHKEMFCRRDNNIMAILLSIAFVAINVAFFQWRGLVSIFLVGYMVLFQISCEYIETLLSSLIVIYFVWLYDYTPDWKLSVTFGICLVLSNIYAFYKQSIRE